MICFKIPANERSIMRMFDESHATVTSPAYSSLTDLLSLIEPDMRQVDAVIGQRLSSDVPMVGQISQYIISAGGKRLRPVLLLLMAGALGLQDVRKHQLAAVVEFIHTATLLHDDVVDESTLRRGRATANEVFGNAASVLVGDFLYSRAFQMMVECGSMRVMEVLAEATNVIAEGEVLQLMNMHDATLNEEGYLRVIRSKTAKLFEASARLPAILLGAPPAIEQACATYGQALGTAFQVIDDVLDYDGDVQAMGKNLGDDLREGKATLPLIVAMQRAAPKDAQLIRDAIESGGQGQLDAIVRIVRETGSLETTRALAALEAQRAAESVALLPQGAYKDALLQLTSESIKRQI
jgi:octaprenyl-diphosphate synthase